MNVLVVSCIASICSLVLEEVNDDLLIMQVMMSAKSSQYTHTHPFNGPFSGTTQVSRYQNGKTNLDFSEPRDSEWQWHRLGHMQLCTLLQTDNHTSTHHSVFYRPDALPVAQPTASKHWRHRGHNLPINLAVRTLGLFSCCHFITVFRSWQKYLFLLCISFDTRLWWCSGFLLRKFSREHFLLVLEAWLIHWTTCRM